MLSGNGRHRRPRQAPALLVAAGVTGSAIAIPLLGATGASAASGTTWDRVAECESGGSWSANDGNGYYGGLQLTQEDWEKYGGLTFAPSADQASRSQQIAVGENILADEGAGAWEACALLSGLGKDTSAANVDTGVAGHGAPGSGSGSGSASGLDSGLDSGSGSGLDSGSGSGSASGAASSSSSSPSSSASSPSSSSVSPTPSASPSVDSSVSTEASPDLSPSVEATTGSAGSGESGESYASPSPSSSPSNTGNSQEMDSSPIGSGNGAALDGSYTVRLGDTLCGIADSLGLEGGWSELYAENESLLGADPNHILPGQTLQVGVEMGQN